MAFFGFCNFTEARSSTRIVRLSDNTISPHQLTVPHNLMGLLEPRLLQHRYHTALGRPGIREARRAASSPLRHKELVYLCSETSKLPPPPAFLP